MQRLCHVYLSESKIPTNKRFGHHALLLISTLKGSSAWLRCTSSLWLVRLCTKTRCAV